MAEADLTRGDGRLPVCGRCGVDLKSGTLCEGHRAELAVLLEATSAGEHPRRKA